MVRVCLPVLLCAGCVPAIVGEGDIDRETRSFDAFSAVESDGIDVEVRSGGAFEVILQSDENILPHLEAHVVDGTLALTTNRLSRGPAWNSPPSSSTRERMPTVPVPGRAVAPAGTRLATRSSTSVDRRTCTVGERSWLCL